ncbi:signal peptide peptidase-like 2 [Clarias gariepinus]|uniref:signal peptide peptidase-like 2 n=1 Tax=Clarias gariepinus TaxID=13013 RepID=UPI00234E2990|nr:signal peptide peptidase-like 2 [Clarias gariepinus]
MRCLSALSCAALLITQVLGKYGVARFSDLGESRGRDYCLNISSSWTLSPLQHPNTSTVEVYDLTQSVFCSDSDVPDGGLLGRIAMVTGGNCSFYEKVHLAKNHGARGLLIFTTEDLIFPNGNESQYEEVTIPLALLTYANLLDIRARFGDRKQVALYSPVEPDVYFSVVVIFILAVGTVVGGGYWAGVQESKIRMQGEEYKTEEMSPKLIFLLVASCCVWLILLYFFYDNMVYFFIVVFCLVSPVGLYKCLWTIVSRIPVGTCRVPENNMPYLKMRLELRMVLLAVLCASVSIIWGVFRNDNRWAWVLQDILGMAFCAYTLKIFRMHSLKACTLLLGGLLLYDVFFVFITPYFTESGESIMAEVAGGPSVSSTQEKIPMVLKVPSLSFTAVVCGGPFLLLGLGDILLPGLLVAYCHRFDVLVQSSRAYFIASILGYSVGLVLSFVFVLLMKSAQPALLYLVPCTLLFSLPVALWRSELKLYWTGGMFLPSPIPMGPVTGTLDSALSEAPASQEPGVCEPADQDEAPPSPTEQERPQRREDADSQVY